MKHALLVNEKRLHAYADSDEYVAGVIPELIFRLTATNVTDVKERRIPFGGSVNQPGVDVLLETPSGFLEFVPKGKSFWEIGTGKDPRDKANRDYRARTTDEDLSDDEKKETTLVLVTPRSGAQGWTPADQEKWIEDKQKEGPWKDIVVLDGTKLVQWLAFAPGVDLWLAEKMGDKTSGVQSIASTWSEITALSDPPLKPKVFLDNREAAVKAIRELGASRSPAIRFRTDYPDEVPAFVAAAIESFDQDESAALAGRTIVVNDIDSWRSLCEHNEPLVLVAGPRLNWEAAGQELTALTKTKGHAVVFGTHRRNLPDSGQIELRRHRAFEMESLLQENGLGVERARELAKQSQGSIPILLRTLAGNPACPAWASEAKAALLVPALLAGKWSDANDGDREALSEISGRPYTEYRDDIRPFSVRPDPPLSSHNKKWIFISPREGLLFLAPFFDSDVLERFREVAHKVLGENDPALELETDQRFAASIYDKNRKYSGLLVEGVADSLAMLGTRSKQFTACGPTEASGIVASVVDDLLADTTWERWASLNGVLPLMAEAAPEAFLEKVRNAMRADSSPFPELFNQEANHALGGTNYLTGLWWALEALAWDELYLIAVCLILAELDSIDPGGNWSNRPGNSMTSILLPWYPQTCAPFSKRLQAVSAVLDRHPESGWRLLMSLLPSTHVSTSGTHKPTWRDTIPADWSEGAKRTDYTMEINGLMDLAIREARSDTEKLVALISRLDDLLPSFRMQVLQHSQSESVRELAESVRRPIWESLVSLAAKHREYSEADWALPPNQIQAIESAADSIKPTAAFFLERRLFSEHDAMLYETRPKHGSWQEQQAELSARRIDGIHRVYDETGVDGVIQFAEAVGSPWKVGYALGASANPDLDEKLLPSLLGNPSEAIDGLVRGYIWRRQQDVGDVWTDSLGVVNWPADQRAILLRNWPFCATTWDRVTSLLGDNVELYWKEISANPYEADSDLLRGVESLVAHKRFCLAARCLQRAIHEKTPELPTELTLLTLEGIVTGEDLPSNQFDSHSVIELVRHIQDHHRKEDQQRLAIIEWNLLPLLDRFSGGAPRTLERHLAEDPEFFSQVISFVYRSKNSDDVDPDGITEHQQHLASAGHRLLHGWSHTPGVADDGKVDEAKLLDWLNRAKELCQSSGRLGSALSRIGHVLGRAYWRYSGELWINPVIAKVLDHPDHGAMRDGFTCELFNQRGTHGFTAGREEREIAESFREKASSIDGVFPNLATSIRRLAGGYENDAARDEARDDWGDY